MAKEMEEKSYRLSLDPDRQVVKARPGKELALASILPPPTPQPSHCLTIFYCTQEKSVDVWGKNMRDPFIVAQLRQVTDDQVLLAPFIRPQNTHLEYAETRAYDLSVLYVSNQEIWLSVD
jgi:hypothetical protein